MATDSLANKDGEDSLALWIAEMRKLIGEFIRCHKGDLRATYGLPLCESSISGAVMEIQDGVYYIGDWRLAGEAGSWRAVYNVPIAATEEIEVILEIGKPGDRYLISGWDVRQLF